MTQATALAYLDEGARPDRCRIPQGNAARDGLKRRAQLFPDSRRPDSGHRQSSPPRHPAGGPLHAPKGVVT